MTRTTDGRQAGFTLIEALVGTALFGLLMVGVFSVVASNSSVLNRGLSKAEAHQNARVSLDQLSHELRMAGYDLSGTIDGLTNPTPIQIAQSNRLTFVADLDRNGTLDQVTYLLSGGIMRREISSWSGGSFPAPNSSILAGDVSSLSFNYFDDAQPNNLAIAAPVPSNRLEDVARVTVSLSTTARTGRESMDFPLFVDVKLRN